MSNPKHQGDRLEQALKAKEKAKELLREVPGISGIGVGWDKRGRPLVKVNLHHKADKATRKKIPKSVDGVRVEVELVEDIFLE